MLLADFIETPSQNCTELDLKAGVGEVITILNINSAKIVAIISASYCPANYVLHDLATKMQSQNCLQQFTILYDKHIDELVTLCVWSWHDLQRFIKNQPNYLEKVMESVGKNENCVQRLLDDASNSAHIFSDIKALNPAYEFQEQFLDLFLALSRGLII